MLQWQSTSRLFNQSPLIKFLLGLILGWVRPFFFHQLLKGTNMKCVELEASQMVMLAECAGHVMQKGDKILVDAAVADRMVLQHKMTKGGDHDLEKLLYKFWQPMKMTIDAPVKASSMAKKVETKEVDAVMDPDVPAAEDFEPENKSMGNTDGSAKKKKKKKKSN